MASSMASISRGLYRTLLSASRPSCSHYIAKFSFSTEPSSGDSYLSDETPALGSDSETAPVTELASAASSTLSSDTSPTSSGSTQHRVVQNRTLENGLDIGIYKAILVGQVGQNPLQKSLKNGRMVTLTTVGTGGMRNERVPFANEEPREYADRCTVQWHRVAFYNESLGAIVMKHAQPGSILYLEGNLEAKVFTDPVTGLVRRVREIAVRRDGRLVFLGNGDNFNQPSQMELKGSGYY